MCYERIIFDSLIAFLFGFYVKLCGWLKFSRINSYLGNFIRNAEAAFFVTLKGIKKFEELRYP